MSWKLFIRILFVPLLLPLSLLYGVGALIYRKLKTGQAYKMKAPLISVGNIYVGGSGKTPVVLELARVVKDAGFHPVLVFKSYKASLQKPQKVLLESKPLEVGDEAMMVKKLVPDFDVYSGPNKTQSLKLAEEQTSSEASPIFILDDGAQHHGVKKDFKIHLWDLSRPLLDLFPFPLGRSREFWFWTEDVQVQVFNRAQGQNFKKTFFNKNLKGEILQATYQVQSIKRGDTGEDLKTDFSLISGIGNFNQLKTEVQKFTAQKPFKLKESVQGKDHDDFSWFKAESGRIYVCTYKDLVKLKDKVPTDKLYVIESDFDLDFKLRLKKSICDFLEGYK